MFLFTLADNERNRVVQNRFQYSGGTVSRYFNKFLKACLRLGKHYVKQAGKDIPQEISSNPFLSLVQGFRWSYRWNSHSCTSTYGRTIKI